jgi:chemotaxis signal transduction protein
MSPTENNPFIDINALKAQIDADIAAQLLSEVDDGQHIYRRSFCIGELNLLVELDVTSEVAELPTVCRLPGAPHGVKGLVNRHGRVMPVLDLALLFGSQIKPAIRPWLLVCGRGDAAVGLIVDNLPERKSFAFEDAINLAEVDSPMTPYARAAYQQGKDIWLDIDSEAFFASVFKVEVVTA